MLSHLSHLPASRDSQWSYRLSSFRSSTTRTVTWQTWCSTRSRSCRRHRQHSPSTTCSNASTTSTNSAISAPYSQLCGNCSWTWPSDAAVARVNWGCCTGFQPGCGTAQSRIQPFMANPTLAKFLAGFSIPVFQHICSTCEVEYIRLKVIKLVLAWHHSSGLMVWHALDGSGLA